MESTSGMVKPRVDPDPGSRLSTPGKLLLRLVKTKAIVDAREVLLQADIREAPLEADDGEDNLQIDDTGEALLQTGAIESGFRLNLQIVAVGRYLPRLCETLGQSPLKE